MSERGVEFKGGSLHDEFGGFDDSGVHLALLLACPKNTVPMMVWAVLVVWRFRS